MRILLADNHRLLCEGLRSLLEREPDLLVVGEARHGEEAVRLARELVPDLVLMDVMMPVLNGIEATRQIRSENPRIRVVALSMHEDRRYVLGMLEAGANGYLLKDCPFDEIARALRAVAAGKTYLAPEIAGLVVDSFTGRSPGAAGGPAPHLSPRERQVLQLLAEGCTTRGIARRLHVSVKTVETHRRNMMEKLGIDSIAGLIRYSIQEGITSLDGPGPKRDGER